MYTEYYYGYPYETPNKMFPKHIWNVGKTQIYMEDMSIDYLENAIQHCKRNLHKFGWTDTIDKLREVLSYRYTNDYDEIPF